VKKLDESLTSLELTTSDHVNVEVLVRADEDDTDTVKYLASDRRKFHVCVIVGPRGNGYADLHKMYNELCALSRGRFLFLWNDDATMLTHEWDKRFAQFDDGKLCYVNSRVSDSRGRDQFLFPIVHRSYYEALGRFSASAHNDTYVHEVLRHFPQVFRETDIVVGHSALELIAQRDRTSEEAKAQWPLTKGLFCGPEVQEAINADIKKIRELIQRQDMC
jgi:hypothetical protein